MNSLSSMLFFNDFHSPGLIVLKSMYNINIKLKTSFFQDNLGFKDIHDNITWIFKKLFN